MLCNLLSLISEKKFAEHLYHGLPFGLAFWITKKKENTKQLSNLIVPENSMGGMENIYSCEV